MAVVLFVGQVLCARALSPSCLIRFGSRPCVASHQAKAKEGAGPNVVAVAARSVLDVGRAMQARQIRQKSDTDSPLTLQAVPRYILIISCSWTLQAEKHTWRQARQQAEAL